MPKRLTLLCGFRVVRQVAPPEAVHVSGADAQLPRAQAPTDDACSVCLEDFPDPLPMGDVASPAAAGRFRCRHSVCQKCDARLQRHADPRCPLCRAPRMQWVPQRP